MDFPDPKRLPEKSDGDDAYTHQIRGSNAKKKRDALLVEAVRRAVFPERVASARIDAWFAPPKRKKKRFPREISDAARAAQTVVAALAAKGLATQPSRWALTARPGP